MSDVSPERSESAEGVCVCTHSFLSAAAMVTLFFKDIARLSSYVFCGARGVVNRKITISCPLLSFLYLFLPDSYVNIDFYS